MSAVVSWVLQVSIKDGQRAAFQSLMDEMVASTRNEPGALIYEWFEDDDAGHVHIYERYADSDAVLTHLGAFGDGFGERFFGCVDVVAFHVYGSPSDAAREALTGAGASVLGPFGDGGFAA